MQIQSVKGRGPLSQKPYLSPIPLTLNPTLSILFISDYGKPDTPHLVTTSRQAYSEGTGYYLGCGHTETLTLDTMEICFQECQVYGSKCKSFSFQHQTKTCLLHDVRKSSKCAIVESRGFEHWSAY